MKRRGRPKLCLCGCKIELTGKQRFWASDACRSWYNRSTNGDRVTTGFDRVTTGLRPDTTEVQPGSTGFFPNRKRSHEGDIRQGKIDPTSPGKLKKRFKVQLIIDFSEKYDTQRQETELYALINHKILREHIKKLLEDYNPGWTATVEISKKSVTD